MDSRFTGGETAAGRAAWTGAVLLLLVATVAATISARVEFVTGGWEVGSGDDGKQRGARRTGGDALNVRDRDRRYATEWIRVECNGDEQDAIRFGIWERFAYFFLIGSH